jgi:hypothetical protein
VIQRLLFILMGLVVAAIGVFVGLCVAAFVILRGAYLFIRRSLFGAPQPRGTQSSRSADTIETSYTVIREEDPR